MLTRVHSRQYSHRIKTVLILKQAFEICHYDICKCLKTTNIITNKTSFCSCIVSKLKFTNIKLKIGVKLLYVSTNIYYIYSVTFSFTLNFMNRVLKWERWQSEMTTILNLMVYYKPYCFNQKVIIKICIHYYFRYLVWIVLTL